jgi:hypothetical protein
MLQTQYSQLRGSSGPRRIWRIRERIRERICERIRERIREAILADERRRSTEEDNWYSKGLITPHRHDSVFSQGRQDYILMCSMLQHLTIK